MTEWQQIDQCLSPFFMQSNPIRSNLPSTRIRKSFIFIIEAHLVLKICCRLGSEYHFALPNCNQCVSGSLREGVVLQCGRLASSFSLPTQTPAGKYGMDFVFGVCPLTPIHVHTNFNIVALKLFYLLSLYTASYKHLNLLGEWTQHDIYKVSHISFECWVWDYKTGPHGDFRLCICGLSLTVMSQKLLTKLLRFG